MEYRRQRDCREDYLRIHPLTESDHAGNDGPRGDGWPGHELTSADFQQRSLTIEKRKSGRAGEIVYVQWTRMVWWVVYAKAEKISLPDCFFPVSRICWEVGFQGGRQFLACFRHELETFIMKRYGLR